MEITHSSRDGCSVVTITGRIGLFTAERVKRALVKELVEHPQAVICDLSGVSALDPLCASIFSTAAHTPSSHWPATSLLLCGARPRVADTLRRLRVPHFLPMYATVEEALAEATARPPYLRDELRLAPTPAAATTARDFVRDLLDYWRVGLSDSDVVDRAVLLADELVTNAIVHARTEFRLRVAVSGDQLRLAVHDDSPRRPRLALRGPEAESGRGLRLVERTAKAWGVHHHAEGGKTVWCTLAL
jgi:anti-anti-sigma regulatory factor/anti-sigma regulatory factor (Ser/Thr protein kinase)